MRRDPEDPGLARKLAQDRSQARHDFGRRSPFARSRDKPFRNQVGDTGAESLPVAQVWVAAGAGKQRMVILPERNTVIIRQTSRMLLGERSGFSDVEFLRLPLN